jgi:membrane-bound lytic murein transglycosylase D
MRRAPYLLLISLFFSMVSCTQSLVNVEAEKPNSSETPTQFTQQEPHEILDSQAVPSSSDSGEVVLPSTPDMLQGHSAPAIGPSTGTAEFSNQTDSGTSEQEVYTDQKRIDDALDIYQEALDNWNLGESEKAIQSLDRSYLIISTILSENDPEIRQQKEDLRLLISKRILEIYAFRSHPQVGSSQEIPLAKNEHVAREIKLFQQQERRFFIESYRRSGKFRPYIVEEIRKAGLPEELSWLPLIESGFKTKALSKARALGLWQFIASTGYRFDLRRDRWVDERMDPERSTQAAIAYLKALHDLFGDWTTVLAAYNCGEGNVLRVIRQQHVNYLDDFWDLYSRLPLETARYVPRFLAALHIIKHPEAYGFIDLQLDQPLRHEKVEVKRQLRLKDVARVVNVPLASLEELNPSLRYKATPNYAFSLKVPPDKGAALLASLEQIPTWQPPKRSYVVHRVRFGETLSEIARKYRVSVRQIVHTNNLRSASRIRTGQRLRIPLRSQLVVASSRPPPKDGSTMHYRVRHGDSLWLIARRFNTTVYKLKALNGIESNLLHSGQVLRVQ